MAVTGSPPVNARSVGSPSTVPSDAVSTRLSAPAGQRMRKSSSPTGNSAGAPTRRSPTVVNQAAVTMAEVGRSMRLTVPAGGAYDQGRVAGHVPDRRRTGQRRVHDQAGALGTTCRSHVTGTAFKVQGVQRGREGIAGPVFRRSVGEDKHRLVIDQHGRQGGRRHRARSSRPAARGAPPGSPPRRSPRGSSAGSGRGSRRSA